MLNSMQMNEQTTERKNTRPSKENRQMKSQQETME